MRKEVTIGDYKGNLPADWDSMSEGELHFLAGLLDRKRTSFEVCVMMLLFSVGGRMVSQPEYDDGICVVQIHGRRYSLTVEQLSDLAEIYAFLFDSVFIPEPSLTPLLTRNHFRRVSHGGCQLTGPEDGMLSISFGSYVWLQTFLSGASHDSHNLSMALACLWRSDKGTDEPLESDAKVIESLPAWKQMIMFWFVSGCLQRIHRLFPRVFKGTGGVAGNVLDQQLRLLDSLAGSDMTKKDQVREGKLIDALYVIDEAVRKKEEREQQLAKAKKR